MKLFLAILALATSLLLSATAAYFSVVGLVALFAANAIGVAIMASSIEAGKIVTSVIAKTFWGRHWVLNSALIASTLGIMAITSMGVFGYLMAGHMEQSAPVAGISIQAEGLQAQIAQREDENKRLTARLSQIDQITSASIAAAGTSASSGRAALRTSERQKKERQTIQDQMDANYQEINAINAKLIPLKQESAGVEAKLGPIKQLAKPLGITDTEGAVRVVVMMIIPVFDPLAILLMIASLILFHEWKDEREVTDEEEPVAEEPARKVTFVEFTDADMEASFVDPEPEYASLEDEMAAQEETVAEAPETPSEDDQEPSGDGITRNDVFRAYEALKAYDAAIEPDDNDYPIELFKVADDHVVDTDPADEDVPVALTEVVDDFHHDEEIEIVPVEETVVEETKDEPGNLLAELEQATPGPIMVINDIQDYDHALTEFIGEAHNADRTRANQLSELIREYENRYAIQGRQASPQTPVSDDRSDRQKMIDILERDPDLVLQIAESVKDALNRERNEK